jgi:Gpi18-like mannosyltransferase
MRNAADKPNAVAAPASPTIPARTMPRVSRPIYALRFLLLAAGIALAVFIRYSWRDFISDDFTFFLNAWYAAFQTQGFAALRTGFSNYTPAYLYILFLESQFFPALNPLYAIKLPSVMADFLCAWLVQRIATIKYGSGSFIPWLGFLAVLFLPTVILNGSVWGQSDGIFTSALLACLYFLMRNRPTAAFLSYGLAFALKMQSLFLLPFLILLWWRGSFSWRQWLWIPLVYAATILPAWLAGRPLADLLTVYIAQANLPPFLMTLNAPNLYALLPQNSYAVMYPAGLMLCAGICAAYVFAGHRSKNPLTPSVLIFLAFFSVLLVPFFLPKMHERYFFPADVLSVVLALYFPDLFFVPILVCGISFVAYLPFLFHVAWLPFPIAAGILFCTLLLFMVRLRLLLFRPSPKYSEPS